MNDTTEHLKALIEQTTKKLQDVNDLIKNRANYISYLQMKTHKRRRAILNNCLKSYKKRLKQLDQLRLF